MGPYESPKINLTLTPWRGEQESSESAIRSLLSHVFMEFGSSLYLDFHWGAYWIITVWVMFGWYLGGVWVVFGRCTSSRNQSRKKVSLKQNYECGGMQKCPYDIATYFIDATL